VNMTIDLFAMIALLGSAVMSGTFFAFSNFVMKSLARLPSKEGIAAMQSINIVVINPVFMIVFMGTALLSVAIVGWSWLHLGSVGVLYFALGAVSYLAGTFMVTITGNVPLNNQLATVSAAAPESVEVWDHYVRRWSLWNHVRTVAPAVAVVFFLFGLIENAVR